MTKYKLDGVDRFMIYFSVSITVAFILLLSSCNAYKQIEKHEPQSVKDTARLLTRYTNTFKPKPPVIKQGKTIYIKDTSKLAQLRKSYDSLKSLPPKILTIHDSCGEESVDGFAEGFKIGEQKGRYEGLQDCEGSTERIDTLFQDSPETLALLYNQKVKAGQDAKTIASLTTDKITLKAQKQAKNSENWFWRVVALLAIGWAVFKPKIIKLVNQLKDKL